MPVKRWRPKNQLFMPVLFALTICYSIVYHLMNLEITEDECANAEWSGGIVPPQCFELAVFRDWHEKEADDLLAPESVTRDNIESVALATSVKGRVSWVVDEYGQTFAEQISEDLAGLEKKFSQFLDHKYDETHTAQDKVESTEQTVASSDRQSTSLSSWGASKEALREQVRQGLHTELDKLESAHADVDTGNHGSASFGDFHAQLEARHKERSEHRGRLVREIAHQMDILDKNLQDVVSDHKAWESTVLQKHKENLGNVSEEMALPPQTSFMSKRLQWSVLPTIHHQKHKGSDFLEASKRRPIVVSKHDVRHMHWKGKLPKVAAIAWVKGDRKTRARMMYFVDNFNLQDYEGERELLLVYHQKDADAAQIVSRYANVSNIKTVVALDKSEEMFPSDLSLRYAAWSSDADVIAQWDFDEYHDPSRLSLQVRAMAYASGHACVLSTTSTSHSQEDETKEIHQVSLTGEKSWMKEHWHPFSAMGSEVLELFWAGGIVELDMQNKALMGNISRLEHVFQATTTSPVSAQDHANVEEGTDFSRGIEECLNYDHTQGHESEDVAEKAVTEKAGKEFGKKFHNLVKRRRDIIMKLQLLCFQATMEKDVGKRKLMHDHVLEMDQIRADLDKHITNTASLFGAQGI